MCGIAGELRLQPGPTAANWPEISKLMQRRGPDDDGLWDDTHCTLAFRRLAILDLSPRGHQPMIDPTGRYVLVFNGEIYNFRELRADLEARGETFTSNGDTEVLLRALICWDIAALERLNGIFALALYDNVDKTLLLARDHAGIKPLYFMRDERGVVFGSQFNQILRHPWSADHEIDQDALALYLQHSYVPAPFAMLSGTSMLDQGCWIRFAADGRTQHGSYWTFPFPLEPTLGGNEAIEAVDSVIGDAVHRQMVSDVPVGAFLSGGIDSPLVVAKILDTGHSQIRTYTIATDDADSDESDDAKRYAAELGVDHVIETITSDQALSLLPDVIESQSEPFGDYSIFPTMLVSKFSSQEFKVMLSGDGGDELFWGYPDRTADLIRFAPTFKTPYPVRRLRALARSAIGKPGSASLSEKSIGSWYRVRHTTLKHGWVHKVFPEIGDRDDVFDGYDYDGYEQNEAAQWLRLNEFRHHLTMVLLKVDRASMHFSQEVRVPLLDKEVVQTAAQVDWQSCLSLDSKLGKRPLRDALARHVRHQTTAKRGFESPMAQWLRGPLREQFEELVMNRDNFFGQRIDKAALRMLYDRHLSGTEDHAMGLWPLLSLAFWQEHHFRDSM
jgi:asparagine synthase (glutamine-hydrolysing)